MSANVIYSAVNFRRKRQDDGPQAGDIVYSQVKFPDPPPFHSASQDGQAVPQSEDVIYSQVTFQPPHPPGLQAETEWTQKISYSRYRLFSLGLGLLFLLFFIIIIFLSVHLYRVNQTWSLTEDNLKQLWTNYSILTKEKDRLQEDHSFLVKKKEELQDNWNNDRDQLQEENKMLTNDKNQLQEENKMQANDKNQLQEENKMLANDMDQLQKQYNILTNNNNLLRNKYNALANSNNLLRIEYNTLANSKDLLQNDYNILLNKLPFLKDYCKPGKVCSPCPSGWKIFNDKCYYQHRSLKTWEESKKFCSELGGNLTMIENQEEQEFIKTIIKDGNSWIGLTDRKQERSWLWVNGAQLKKSFWAIGEPNNRPESWILDRRTADCVYFKAKEGIWFDDDCDRKLNCLCETELL